MSYILLFIAFLFSYFSNFRTYIIQNINIFIYKIILIWVVTFSLYSRGESNEDFVQNQNAISQPNQVSSAKMSNDELIQRLSQDEDFRGLSDMITFFEEMPNKENFVKNFDKETLETQKDDAYFINISGYSQAEVTNAKSKVNNHLTEIFSKFPELKELDQETLNVIMTSASDIYFDSFGEVGKIKCSTCGKIGRAKMVFYTATGVATCSIGGPYAAWACGVAGFDLAGYEALGCLEDCQK